MIIYDYEKAAEVTICQWDGTNLGPDMAQDIIDYYGTAEFIGGPNGEMACCVDNVNDVKSWMEEEYKDNKNIIADFDYVEFWKVVDNCITEAAAEWVTYYLDEEEALLMAESDWERLTKSDKKRRDNYYVLHCWGNGMNNVVKTWK